MKSKKLLAIVCMCMVLILLVGCGTPASQPANNDVIPSQQVDDASAIENKPAEDAADTDTEDDLVSEMYSAIHLAAEKIGTINTANRIDISDAGVRYQTEDGKYGIISLDSQSDTGARYSYCVAEDEYFLVREEALGESASDYTAEKINSMGLVDTYGTEIIPKEYASISILSERYAKVVTVSGTTESEDEALIYFTDSMLSFSPGEEDILYKGNWYIFDMLKGGLVEGVSGTLPYGTSVYGNYIRYTTDDGVHHYANGEGKELPQNVRMFENGCYSVTESTLGTVYDSDDNMLFSYHLDGFIPVDSKGDYIHATMYIDGSTKSVLMNKSGEIVSAQFDNYIEVYEDLVFTDGQLLDLDGNAVVEGTYDIAYFDEELKNALILKNDDLYTVVAKDGTVIYSVQAEDGLYVDPTYFSVKKNMDGKAVVYSYADKDYTLEGNNFAAWITQTEHEGKRALVNLMTGETLVDGYFYYHASGSFNTKFYVIAQVATGEFDIYVINRV